ncbi:hypothetical protein JHN55_22970 [Streptomyces sp. MBT56]|uniref:hypothetical protein n=1 Tax=unclassified Streptomyces TaxID=2593676 RepID=UPI00190B7617|nr:MULTISPECIES: hypothetical protein [unclassified Streptomyces]MBK3559333.1 hypothetical protein [Streptomyces sp. MBT56]MBK3602982.1 hypothetical protein [Streptomyces sp. MBT54]MBK3616280.1 hypothetical protein [Streptomyces sp. MBT98]MBK6047541.1 hypothetical protein [Streptomyces sp. MBT55]
MTAFDASKNTRTLTFTDTNDRPVTVRPYYDAALGRNVVELVVHGATVRLSCGIIPSFTDGLSMAALFGEIENVVTGNPTTLGK